MSAARVHGAARDDLTGEHRFSDIGQALFAFLFGAVWALDSFVLEWTTFANDVVPGPLRALVGFVLLAVSAAMAFLGMRAVFAEKRDPPVVIRTGLFGYIRHPIYFAEVLLYTGLVCLSISLAAAAVLAGAVVFLHRLCRHEERLLLDRFGEEYRGYMRDVGMWFPRLRRHRR